MVFRHPTDPRGFAKVYIFRDDGSYNLKDLQRRASVAYDGPSHRRSGPVPRSEVRDCSHGPPTAKPARRPPEAVPPQGRDIANMTMARRAKSPKAPGGYSRGFPLRLQFQCPPVAGTTAEDHHEDRVTLLLGLRIRTQSRQFDGQASHRVQDEDQGLHPGPSVRRVLRGVGRWRPDLLEAEDRRVPGRESGGRAGRRAVEVSKGVGGLPLPLILLTPDS